MHIYPPAGDGRVVSSAGSLIWHRLWLNDDVIHNRLHRIHLTCNLLHPVLGLQSRCHAGEIHRTLDGLDAYLSRRLHGTAGCKMRLD